MPKVFLNNHPAIPLIIFSAGSWRVTLLFVSSKQVFSRIANPVSFLVLSLSCFFIIAYRVERHAPLVITVVATILVDSVNRLILISMIRWHIDLSQGISLQQFFFIVLVKLRSWIDLISLSLKAWRHIKRCFSFIILCEIVSLVIE